VVVVRVRAGAAALTLAAAALVLVWRLMPSISPPLYDGCITEPYRLVGGNPAPTSASQTYPAGSSFQPAEVITGESPAQGQILMMEGTFVSSSPFMVTVTPVPPPRPAPAGQRFDGNAYRIVAAAPSGQMLQPQAQDPVTIVLRATGANGPTRTIMRLDGDRWTPLKTFSAGCGDEYEAVSSRMGIFAIVEPAGASPPEPGGFPTLVLIPVLLLVLIGAVYALVRLNRPRPVKR
jgi:hypothetical protein